MRNLSRRVLIALLALWAAMAAAQTEKTLVAPGFFLTSDGVRLHYLQAGSGPAIVFVPGWTMPAAIWQEQIAYFAKHHRVVALDPRSQGDSDKPAEGHYPERRGRDVKELVDHLKLAPAVLVGWSMGVPELLAYVDQFGSGDVRGLVLVDGFVNLDPSFVGAFAGLVRELQMNRQKFTEAFVRSMYNKPQSEAYIGEVVNASLKTPTNSAAALMVGSVGKLDWTGALAKLGSAPLLYVCTPRLKPQADMVRQKLPSARVEIFEDAGHALFVDDAERFNKLVEEFVKPQW